jgi:hypothetical protein
VSDVGHTMIKRGGWIASQAVPRPEAATQRFDAASCHTRITDSPLAALSRDTDEAGETIHHVESFCLRGSRS